MGRVGLEIAGDASTKCILIEDLSKFCASTVLFEVMDLSFSRLQDSLEVLEAAVYTLRSSFTFFTHIDNATCTNHDSN